MKNKRLLSLVLCIMVLLSALPQIVLANTDAEKMERQVYLYAQSMQGTDAGGVYQYSVNKSDSSSIVYKGDTVNIFLAVDDPNKGDGIDDDGKPIPHKYDLNGYTVKITFDGDFFEYKDDMIPFDYTYPNRYGKYFDTNEDEETGNDIGYRPYFHGRASVPNTTYETAYATIMLGGDCYYEPIGNKDYWYNLLCLPLTPKKTGYTKVWIETVGVTDPYNGQYKLELLAKNTSTDVTEQAFNLDVKNSGEHYILIQDRDRPEPPTESPAEGRYTASELNEIKLYCEHIIPGTEPVGADTVCGNCRVYYTTNENASLEDYILYTKPITENTDTTQTIYCYTERISDGKRSSKEDYTYTIIPEMPHLFTDTTQKELIPNYYVKNVDEAPFGVCVSDNISWGAIANDSEVYYTFAKLDETSLMDRANTDPYTQWVLVEKGLDKQKFNISKSCTIRLITDKMGELSDIAEYDIKLKPAVVTATPSQGSYNDKVTVELSTQTPSAVIYYTTDGTNPVSNGNIYDSTLPIDITYDTTINAVAYLDGQYGDISSFEYTINYTDNEGITAFRPSGTYEGRVDVTLSPVNPDKKIEYSTDGGQTWKKGNTVLPVIEDNTEVLARVTVGDDGQPGKIHKFTYKIKPKPPVFAPATDTQFTKTDNVTIYCEESYIEFGTTNSNDYTLYYTLDGSNPSDEANPARMEGEDHDDHADMAVIPVSSATEIKAVVKKNDTYSDIVTHYYTVVSNKPAKPQTTLPSGQYILEIDDSNGYEFNFTNVPNGTTIWYTITDENTSGEFLDTPIPNAAGSTRHNGTPIKIDKNTTIKAIAVDDNYKVKSDIAVFEYVVKPEAPKTAPNSKIDALPVIPVHSVENSEVIYTVNGEDNSVPKDKNTGIFYINTQNGNAYKTDECRPEDLISSDTQKIFTDKAEIEIYSVIGNEKSSVTKKNFEVTANAPVTPPYPDKEQGMYFEEKIEGDADNILYIRLKSHNSGATIKYRKYIMPTLDNTGSWTEGEWVDNGEWKTYSLGETIKLSGDTMIQAYSQIADVKSKSVSYVYTFKPLAPIFDVASGIYTYDADRKTKLYWNEHTPDSRKDANKYPIWYRINTDVFKSEGVEDIRYTYNNDDPKAGLAITENVSYRAYVKSNLTGRMSDAAISSYTIEEAGADNGDIQRVYPYNVDTITSHLLSTGIYAEGIRMTTRNTNAAIRYQYRNRFNDGRYEQGEYRNPVDYDNKYPIIVNESFYDITIKAWLVSRANGTTISEKIFHIDFIAIPKIEKSYNAYTLINDYPTDAYTILYYTFGADSDPRDLTQAMEYNGEHFNANEHPVIRAVYYRACRSCAKCSEGKIRECENSKFGEVGTYNFFSGGSISGGSAVGGGGGAGGNTSNKVSSYTKDIFGTDHPTHIGYINGYPDGSVQPDGNITREEVAAVLYRVKYKAYDEPFAATGTVFSDVDTSRWSVNDIEYMTDKGIILGYPDGEFKPARNLTRAEFAALIRRFADFDKIADDNIFSDLDESHWAYEDIMVLTNAGLFNGYEDGTVRPEREISRAEVMTVVNKILGRCPSDSYVKELQFNPYNDLDKNAWHYTTVLEATITHDYYLNNEQTLEIKWENWK